MAETGPDTQNKEHVEKNSLDTTLDKLGLGILKPALNLFGIGAILQSLGNGAAANPIFSWFGKMLGVSEGGNNTQESGPSTNLAAKHEQILQGITLDNSKNNILQDALGKIEANKGRYEKVAQAVNLPWKLIAAIHYREGGLNFGTKLHNGEALHVDGTKARKLYPYTKPFANWEDAAIDALRSRDKQGLSKDSTSLAKMAAFSEKYNGMGYANKNMNSPYVYAGTNKYTGGMYVSDGKFSATAKDPRVGVIPIIQQLT